MAPRLKKTKSKYPVKPLVIVPSSMLKSVPIPDRVGDEQRKKTALKQKIEQAYREGLGRDGAPPQWDPRGRTMPNYQGKAPGGRGWQNSTEGTEDPQRVQALRGRRRKGNRYYRTD